MKKIITPILFIACLAFCSFNSLPKEQKEKIVEIKTDFGKIYIWLYKDTPRHRENFLKLVDEKMYDGAFFHRIIEHFMIQGGDPYSLRKDKQDSLGEGDLGYALDAEFVRAHFHKRGVIAAARNGDDVNPMRQSSACQFYIVQGRKMSDEDLLKYELRVQKALKDTSFHYTVAERDYYKSIGGTSWLDMQYTVYGEVIAGMDVVDKIAAQKKDEKDRPLKNIKMKMKIRYFSKEELLKRFSFSIPN